MLLQEIFKFEALHGGYSFIRYDAWQKVYYRFALKPVSPDEYHSPMQIWQNPTIIILNNNFEQVGGFDLPKDSHFWTSFINKDGLHIFNNMEYDKNDDYVVFDTYKLKPISTQ